MKTKNLLSIISLTAIALSGGFSLQAQNQANNSWYPSGYGAADEIGAANLITPEVVMQAVKLVKTGKTYPLAVPVDKNLPAFRHRSFHLYNIQPGEQGGQTLGPNKFSFNDELVNAWTGVGTQLNGIGHIGIDNVYYNGNKATDFVTVEGVKKLGIEKVPPIVTRGVVLDMTAHYGKAIVPGGTEFSVADIQAVLKKQGLTIRKGDVVLFNTGWLELIGKDNKQFLEVEPGLVWKLQNGWPIRASLLLAATPGLRKYIPIRKAMTNFPLISLCWQNAASTIWN